MNEAIKKLAETIGEICTLTEQKRYYLANKLHDAGYRLPAELKVLGTNPHFLRDTDGNYYNKYPEFQIYEEAKQAQRDYCQEQFGRS